MRRQSHVTQRSATAMLCDAGNSNGKVVKRLAKAMHRVAMQCNGMEERSCVLLRTATEWNRSARQCGGLD
nr:MAG TPA: hypothetical protein [Caudoviricetes sp.]